MAWSAVDAVGLTHAWFEHHSGWAPPDPGTLAEWLADDVCRCPDECLVEPAQACPHGLASWWLVLCTLDRPYRAAPIDPVRLAPHPDRLSPDRPDFRAVVEAHHRAIEAGRPTYVDPVSGTEIETARALWERPGCCGADCRHCPYLSG